MSPLGILGHRSSAQAQRGTPQFGGNHAMPSARPTRGRPRPRNAALRGARPRLRSREAESSSESPAAVGHPGGDIPGREAAVAATPQPGWQASLRGLRTETRHPLGRMWAQKRFGLLMLGIWALLLLCYCLWPGFSNHKSPNKYVLWSGENADGQSLEKESAMEALLSFFSPTTCIPKEDQVVKACNGRKDLNMSECLKYKCCYSETGGLGCFAPLKDTPTQMFRVFVLGVSSMIILGLLPVYCCSFCRRSRWASPLRRKVNRILKGLKKPRNKQRRYAEIIEVLTEDEEGDEREQESRGSEENHVGKKAPSKESETQILKIYSPFKEAKENKKANNIHISLYPE
ncbi:FMR1 neighbor protein [Elephas maximus indicus]|uniref:FMR1 neighbor protein n=1 Tax=Elephas maximus indicus TaxID=99487 RepID=UPI0021165460|nr:FMR1 neighbor protein [Elephas maximus indicus]